jgi:hypothetical protein
VAIHYLSGGRDVRTNHILNPDFEIDASNWRPLNANSTIEVVDGHQFHGGKALKITGDGANPGDIYGAAYDGPLIAVADVRAPLTTGYPYLVASMSSDTASVIGTLGCFKYADSAGTLLTSAGKYCGTMTSTPKRSGMNIAAYIYGGLDNTNYLGPQIIFEHNGPGVYYVDAVMLTADYAEGDPGWPDFISGNRTNGVDGLNYAWTGAAHASTSTGTATRWVDLAETGAIGAIYTITGGGFIPSEPVRVTVTPAVANYSYWDTTANSDGTFQYSFAMPIHTGGTTKVRVSGSAAWMGYPYAEQDVTIPVPPPLVAPTTTAERKVNYFLDPRLQVTDAVTTLIKNYFHNPSPTASLDQYSAAGTASIALDPSVSIKGEGGVTVTSPDSVSGVTFALTYEWDSLNFTVYVRAHEAMTITGSQSSEFIMQDDQYVTVGWGDFGWGEPFDYTPGFSYTFAAGEVRRFRIYSNVLRTYQGGTYPGVGDINFQWHLKGSGTFDVDAVWVGGGVDDGVDPDGFPGGVDSIPNAPLFFSGDTPDDDTYTYAWEGMPNASVSVKNAAQTKYLRTWNVLPGREQGYIFQLPGGEKVAAVQSAWGESARDSTYFTADGPADGVGEDLKYLGLVEGKHYALSFDLTSAMENYVEGYIGGAWDQMWLTADDAYLGIPMGHPLERRLTIPFTVGADAAKVSADLYRDWVTGYHFIDNVSLVEIDFHMPQYEDAQSGVPGTLDILALGAVAGGAYTAIADTPLDPDDYYRAEYQAEVDGAWTTITEVLHDADNKSDMREWSFTIPEGAVGARLAWFVASGWPYFNLYSTPIPFFDGDTPDGDGLWYWWDGTPGESASIRSTTPPPEPPSTSIVARVLFGGVPVPVSDMRVKMGTEHIHVIGWQIT